MAKGRSPNYPQIPLDEACERARKVYKAEHTHVAAREVVAKALGYSSMNGSALAALSTLRQYGLLAQTGDGLRISDDAVSVLELPTGDVERNAALRRLAFTPPLFRELSEKFGEKLPSDVNMRHFLIKDKKFLPNAAEQLIRVYRANLEIVGSSPLEDNEPAADNKAVDQNPLSVGGKTMEPQVDKGNPVAGILQSPIPAGLRDFPLYLTNHQKGALYVPADMSMKDYDLLKRQIENHLAIILVTSVTDD